MRGRFDGAQLGQGGEGEHRRGKRIGRGNALYLAQIGRKHPDAKPLTGVEGGVLEVVEDFDKNTYRAVYKVQLGDVVYVLHVFQKKSKSGKGTPKPDLDLIRSRLKLAKQNHERRTKAKGKP